VRVSLAREAAPLPVVCAVWREEETTNRFGFRTTERRWDGLGQVSERGEVQPLAEGLAVGDLTNARSLHPSWSSSLRMGTRASSEESGNGAQRVRRTLPRMYGEPPPRILFPRDGPSVLGHQFVAELPGRRSR
jgi:hypothetical protein